MPRSLLQRFWLGLATIPIAIVVAVIVTQLWGTVFGIWGWMQFAAILLVMTVIVLALAEEFMRPPNPYTRTHHLYDLRDVSPKRDLQSASATTLWQALPPALGALVLFIVSRL